MATIGTIRFSRVERDFICFAINTFGDGQHPHAGHRSFPFFMRDYAKQCVTRARDQAGLVDFQRVVAEDILRKLETAK